MLKKNGGVLQSWKTDKRKKKPKSSWETRKRKHIPFSENVHYFTLCYYWTTHSHHTLLLITCVLIRSNILHFQQNLWPLITGRQAIPSSKMETEKKSGEQGAPSPQKSTAGLPEEFDAGTILDFAAFSTQGDLRVGVFWTQPPTNIFIS